jgi:thymidine kinase
MEAKGYGVKKTAELVESAKIAVDILLSSLKESFVLNKKKRTSSEKTDEEVYQDYTMPKSFIETKKVAFFSAKELIKEIEKLEKQLEEDSVELDDKQFSNNFLEDSAENVK